MGRGGGLRRSSRVMPVVSFAQSDPSTPHRTIDDENGEWLPRVSRRLRDLEQHPTQIGPEAREAIPTLTDSRGRWRAAATRVMGRSSVATSTTQPAASTLSSSSLPIAWSPTRDGPSESRRINTLVPAASTSNNAADNNGRTSTIWAKVFGEGPTTPTNQVIRMDAPLCLFMMTRLLLTSTVVSQIHMDMPRTYSHWISQQEPNSVREQQSGKPLGSPVAANKQRTTQKGTHRQGGRAPPPHGFHPPGVKLDDADTSGDDDDDEDSGGWMCGGGIARVASTYREHRPLFSTYVRVM